MPSFTVHLYCEDGSSSLLRQPCRKHCKNGEQITHLDEADVCCLLTEALTADIEAILADDTMAVAAYSAANGGGVE
jgi:hypothetical protein